MATDGHRLSWASIAVAGDYARQEVILPRKTVLELSKLLGRRTMRRVTIDILANQVRFRFGNVELVSKVVDGKFPDYNRVIPQGHTKHVRARPRELLSALQRAAILSNEKFRGVRLVLADGELKIICTNSEQEEAEEQLEVDYAAKRSTSASTSPTCSTCCRTPAATRSRSRSATRTRARWSRFPDRDDYKYVVMPMRI